MEIISYIMLGFSAVCIVFILFVLADINRKIDKIQEQRYNRLMFDVNLAKRRADRIG